MNGVERNLGCRYPRLAYSCVCRPRSCDSGAAGRPSTASPPLLREAEARPYPHIPALPGRGRCSPRSPQHPGRFPLHRRPRSFLPGVYRLRLLIAGFMSLALKSFKFGALSALAFTAPLSCLNFPAAAVPPARGRCPFKDARAPDPRGTNFRQRTGSAGSRRKAGRGGWGRVAPPSEVSSGEAGSPGPAMLIFAAPKRRAPTSVLPSLSFICAVSVEVAPDPLGS